MADQREISYLLKLEADGRAAEQAVQQAKRVKTELDRIENQGKLVTKTLQDMQRAAQIDKIGDSFGKMARRIKDTDTAAEQLLKRLKSIGASDSEIQKATAVFGARAGVGDSRARISPALAQFGRELRNQPAIATPLGVSTDAVAKMIALFGSLPPAALGVIAVIAPLAAGFVALESSLAGAKKMLEEANSANKAYYELIAQGAGSDEARKRVEELNRTLAAQRDELASIENAFKQSVDAGGLLYGTLARLSTADDDFTARADELRKSIGLGAAEAARLTAELEKGSFAEADYRKQLEQTNKIRTEAALAGANDEYQRQLKLQRESLMSSSQVMAQITTTRQEEAAAIAALNKLRADKANGVQGLDTQITEFEVQIGRLGADLTRLYGLFANRQPIEEATRIRGESVKAMEGYNRDIVRLEEAAAQNRIAINDRYLDTIEKAVEAAAQGAEAALNKLIEKRAELDLKLARDAEDSAIELERERLDEQIELQREELKDWRAHQAEIARIRRRGLVDETRAIENRDAVALARARDNTANQVSEAAQQFAQENDERRIAYRDQLSDLAKKHGREREDRLRAYRRALDDAASAYRAEITMNQQKLTIGLQQAAQARDRELQLAQQKHSAELSLRAQAVQAELNIIRQGIAARQALEAQLWQQAQMITNPRPVPPPTGNPLTGPLLLNRPNQATSLSFAPTINGSSRNAIQRQIVTSLDQFLTKAGIN